KSGRGVRLSGYGDIVQLIDGLAGIFVANAEIQSQVLPDLEIVLEEIKLVTLLVVNRRGAGRQDDKAGSVGDNPRRAGKSETSIDIGQERDIVGKVADVRAERQPVLAGRPGNGVGELGYPDRAPLRQVRGRPQRLHGGPGNRDAG